MSFQKCFTCLLSIVCIGFAMGGSCNVNVVPPPEAVLVGAWLMSAEDSIQNNRVFVFDDTGRLAEIRTTIGSTTIIERDVHHTTRVTGSNVFVKTRGNLIFEGTLNDTADSIAGGLRTEVNIPFTNNTIITELGSATLTRQ